LAVLKAFGDLPQEKKRIFSKKFADFRSGTMMRKGKARIIPDLIAFESVVFDLKVIEEITDHERGQMLNYLKITGLQVGVILNFKRAKL
jgi:GxxExxY protein